MSIQKIVVSAILKNYIQGLAAWFKKQPYFNASLGTQNISKVETNEPQSAAVYNSHELHFTPSPTPTSTPLQEVSTEPKKTGTSLTSGG